MQINNYSEKVYYFSVDPYVHRVGGNFVYMHHFFRGVYFGGLVFSTLFYFLFYFAQHNVLLQTN